MRWSRLAAIVGTAVIGLGGAYLIWAAPDAPRWTIAVSGLLMAAGGAACVVLLAVLVSVIVEDVRPTIRLRRPAVPLSLAHQEASLVGRKAYRLHPIRFWGVLTLNNRFVFGFMIFGEPEHIDFKVDAA